MMYHGICSVVCFDEPTSGLDSSMALHVATCMGELAAQGLTVVTSIHQPSSQVYVYILIYIYSTMYIPVQQLTWMNGEVLIFAYFIHRLDKDEWSSTDVSLYLCINSPKSDM